jgi:hypothetical protein
MLYNLGIESIAHAEHIFSAKHHIGIEPSVVCLLIGSDSYLIKGVPIEIAENRFWLVLTHTVN